MIAAYFAVVLFSRWFQPLVATACHAGADAALRAANLLRAGLRDGRHEDGAGVLDRNARIVQLVFGAV